MVVSVNWAQEQYFIGDFDGTSFKLMENHPAEPLYVDKGLDFMHPAHFRILTERWIPKFRWAGLQPGTMHR